MTASGWTQYSETQIREILELSKMGMQAADLARRYNVPVVVIHVWQTKYGASAGESDASRLQRLQSEIANLHQLISDLSVEHDELEAKLAAKRG